MTRVTVAVMGGLCSRLRAVAAAALFADSKDLPLTVLWPREEPYLAEFGGFCAKMSDLFDHPYEEIDRIGYFPKALSCRQDGWVVRTCHPEALPIRPIERIAEKLKQWTIGQAVRVATMPLLGDPDSHKFWLLKRVVGVHVRQWVKQPGSPGTGWYVTRMKQLLDINSDLIFFLSCDSDSTSDDLRTAFPDRIAEQPKDYRYDKAGIIKSCADLFLLSRCCWVLGASHSSYGQMVAFLKGARYVLPHDTPGNLTGGDYEDAWNPADEDDRLLNAILP